ncbi:unnamed protein product [Gordionus sp. m RMFG-2023]
MREFAYYYAYPLALITLIILNSYLVYRTRRAPIKEVFLSWLNMSHLNVIQFIFFFRPTLTIIAQRHPRLRILHSFVYVAYFDRMSYLIVPSLYSAHVMINVMAGLELFSENIGLTYFSITSKIKYVFYIKLVTLILNVFLHLHNLVLYKIENTQSVSLLNGVTGNVTSYHVMRGGKKNLNMIIMVFLRTLTLSVLPLIILSWMIWQICASFVKRERYVYCRDGSKANIFKSFLNRPIVRTKKFIFLLFTMSFYPAYVSDLIYKLDYVFMYIVGSGEELYMMYDIHNILKIVSLTGYCVTWFVILRNAKADQNNILI